MTTALGTLQWSPDTFWRATMMDFTSALKGHLASKGVDMKPGVTEAEFREEVERLEQEEKARMCADHA